MKQYNKSKELTSEEKALEEQRSFEQGIMDNVGDYDTDSPTVEQEQKEIPLGGGKKGPIDDKEPVIVEKQQKDYNIKTDDLVNKTPYLGWHTRPGVASNEARVREEMKVGGDIPTTEAGRAAELERLNKKRAEDARLAGAETTRENNLGTTYTKRGNRLFYVDADGQTVGAKRGTINGEIYYRVPNSNDVIKYNEDGTAEVISEQEFQDRKYNGLGALRRRQMSEADMVREAYADFRELNNRVPTQEEFDTILAKYGGKHGMWSWQTIYGGKHGRFNTAMGGGALFGHANAQNMKDMEEQYQNELKAEIAANKNIEDAVMTKDENGNVRGGKVVTSIELPDGTEKTLNVNDANEIVEYIRKWGSNPRKNTEEEIKGLQELLRSKGFEISEDAINGAQTMNGVLDAILNVKDNDKMADLLSAAGVVQNEDRTYTLPSEPTMDDLNAYYQQKKDAFDMNFKNREVERARNRVGLADIAAGAAEALRGSQGANINERNWYNPYYKNLDDQQQRNYNYYVAKQDQAHRERLALEQANAQRKQQILLKQMENQQKDKNNLFEHNSKMAQIAAQESARDSRADKDRKSKEAIAKNHDEALAKIAKDKAEAKSNGEYKPGKNGVSWGGSLYNWSEYEEKQALSAIYNILSRAGDGQKTIQMQMIDVTDPNLNIEGLRQAVNNGIAAYEENESQVDPAGTTREKIKQVIDMAGWKNGGSVGTIPSSDQYSTHEYDDSWASLGFFPLAEGDSTINNGGENPAFEYFTVNK